ncbi:MAG TPA: hypothetical protein VF627_06030 [Abditibacterium sp.]
MKSHFSRVFALGVLTSISASSWAQPNIVPPAAPKPPVFLANPNYDALAIIGAYYGKTRSAKSGRAKLVGTKSILRAGKVVATESVEVQSSWIGFSQLKGAVGKASSNIVYKVESDGNTTTNTLKIVNDGIKEYRFYETQNSWSERVEGVDEAPYLLSTMRLPWALALNGFTFGKELFVERKTVNGQEQIVVSGAPGNEYIFDAKTGNLLILRSSNENEVIEIRYLETEFDVPLEESAFQWKRPEGAKQVTWLSMILKLNF